MKFYLVIAKGPKLGLPIHVDIDLFLLGSTPMCQLRSPHLADRHCALVTRDNKVFLRDFDGGQPTYLNEEQMPAGAEYRVHAGDLIGVGPLEFIVEFGEGELSQNDAEEWAATSLDVGGVTTVLDEVEHSNRVDNAQQAAAQILDRLTLLKGAIKGRLRISREYGLMVARFNDSVIIDEAEIAQIQRELRDNLGMPNQRIVLDFKNVERLSSRGVVMIRDLASWIGIRGSKLAMCRVRSEIQTAIGNILSTPILIFADKATALDAKW
jgi:anti-anti-sigma regulatory factor